jgi:hypothetical protein
MRLQLSPAERFIYGKLERKAAMAQAWIEFARELTNTTGVDVLYAGFSSEAPEHPQDRIPLIFLIVKEPGQCAALAPSEAAALRLVSDRVSAGDEHSLYGPGDTPMKTAAHLVFALCKIYSLDEMERKWIEDEYERERHDIPKRIRAKYREQLASVVEFTHGVFHIFYRTDEMERQCAAAGLDDQISGAILEMLREIGRTPETAKFEFYSQEQIDRDFDPNTGGFYR